MTRAPPSTKRSPGREGVLVIAISFPFALIGRDQDAKRPGWGASTKPREPLNSRHFPTLTASPSVPPHKGQAGGSGFTVKAAPGGDRDRRSVRRRAPGEIGLHRLALQAPPEAGSANRAVARAIAQAREAAELGSQTNPVAVPAPRAASLASMMVSARPPVRADDRHAAIAQAVKLRQAAGFEARGDEDGVGAALQQVRQSLVIADARADPPGVARRGGGECRFQGGVAGSQHGQPAARGHELGRPRSASRSMPFCQDRRLIDGKERSVAACRGRTPPRSRACWPADAAASARHSGPPGRDRWQGSTIADRCR